MSMRVLVTGASGFIGRALCARLLREGHLVRGALRQTKGVPEGVEPCIVGTIGAHTDWSLALRNIDVVVHLAARVHVLRDRSADPWREFYRTNVEGTLCLARQAAATGVRRFIFVSSVKVNGSETFGRPFSAEQVAAPDTLYGRSKYEAELGLEGLSADTSVEVVIIRSPLVYGPRVAGNFRLLVRALSQGLPLPLGAVTHNRRSLVALDNLVDLIDVCLTHSAAKNQTFLVCDGQDLSTTDLLRRMAQAMGRPARLWPLPPRLLQWGARLLGKGEAAQQLLGSLQVDSRKTCDLLGWQPCISVEEGLRRAVQP